MEYLSLGMLAIFSWQDLNRKKIQVWVAVLFIGVVIGLGYVMGDDTFFLRALKGSIPGIVILFLGVLKVPFLGEGDGLALIPIGMLLGLEKTILLFLLSLWFAGVIGCCLLFVKKKKKGETIPFLPFLFFVEGILYLLQNMY